MTIEVEVTTEGFEQLPKDQHSKVLFAAVMGIDRKVTDLNKKFDKKDEELDVRITALEDEKGYNMKLAARTGLIGGMVTMGLFLFGKFLSPVLSKIGLG